MRAPSWLVWLACGLILPHGAMARGQCAPGTECWALLRSVDASGQHAADLASANQALEGETRALREFVERRDRSPAVAELRLDPAQLKQLVRALERGAEKSDGSGARAAPVQLDPRDDLRRYYGGQASVRAFVVAVPDPRVPRLRRSFDLVVAALIRAGAEAHFQFSRYAYPWRVNDPSRRDEDIQLSPQPDDHQLRTWYACEKVESLFDDKYLRALTTTNKKAARIDIEALRAFCRGRTTKSEASCARQSDCGASELTPAGENRSMQVDRLVATGPRNDFGLLVLRSTKHDAARCDAQDAHCKPPSIDLLALYLVPERLSFGVEPNALMQAALRAAWQQAPVDLPRADEARSAEASTQAIRADATRELRRVVLIGPGLSGSLSGVLQVGAQLDWLGVRLVVDSPTINAATNLKLGLSFQPGKVSFKGAGSFEDEPLCDQPPPPDPSANAPAVDLMPMRAWSEWAKCHALVSELSGVTAREILQVTEDSEWGFSELFNGVQRLSVPPNIWEATLGEKRDEIKDERLRAFLPEAELTLNQDVGSEFPPRFSQALSAKVDRLALEHVWQSARDKSVIWIQMTDVRDQLFVARALRRVAPGALMVFPEADELLAHPDYMDELRGARVYANSALDCANCTTAIRFATDDAAGYFAELKDYLDGAVSDGALEKPSSYLVTRAGLWDPSSARDPHETWFDFSAVLVMLAVVVLVAQRLWRLSLLSWQAWWGGGNGLARIALILVVAALLLSLARFNHVPVVTGLSLHAAAALCVGASGISFLVYLRRGQAEAQALPWLLPSEFNLFTSAWNSRVTQAIVVLSILILINAVPSSISFRHSGGHTVASWGLALALFVLLFGNFALQACASLMVPRVTNRLRVGIDDLAADLPQNWIGIPPLPRFATPFAASPDGPYAMIGVVPQLGQLRRVRQVLGAALLIARWHSLLGLGLPLVVMLSIWSSPLPMQNVLLTCSALLLICSAVIMHFVVIYVERDPLASAAFCANSGFRFGAQLATYLVAPIGVVALGLWLAFLPGMREWTQHTLLPFVGTLF